MNICILGATGLLGQALTAESLNRGYAVTGVARSGTDISLDISDDTSLGLFLQKSRFDLVVNCCAIVDHQYCDQHPDQAYLVNARPSAILSQMATIRGYKYAYISTDGYYNGDGDKKHSEKDPIILLNEYARTKYAGELLTLLNDLSLVIRTNIVGFRGWESKPTFLEWVINELSSGGNMKLFNDYYVSSISVTQFSKSFFDLIVANASGIYNLASGSVYSKADFIKEVSDQFGLPLVDYEYSSVKTLSSRRADSLGLDCSKAESILQYKLPTLKEVVESVRGSL